jgi:hypothetical protein
MYKTIGILILAYFNILASINAAPPLPKVKTPEGKAPSDAVVVFDGVSKDGLVNAKGEQLGWKVQDGAVTVKGEGGAFSKEQFQDAQIHVEFCCPKDDKKGGASGNSGLYIHGMYELQIHNSFNEQHDKHNKGVIGAVYGQHIPAINVGRPAEQWQSYDIIYHAPRRDDKGKITTPGSVTVLLNGVLLHDHAALDKPTVYGPLHHKPTPYAKQIKAKVEKEGIGPLFLQDHNSPVKFRNIWLRHLTSGEAAPRTDK